jgi:hypothetical protein
MSKPATRNASSPIVIGPTSECFIMLKTVIGSSHSEVGRAASRVAEGFGFATGPGERSGRPDDPEALARCARAADATLWFGETTTDDAHEVIVCCRDSCRPCMMIYPAASFEPTHVASWLRENAIETLHVAGDRGDGAEVGELFERFLVEVLRLIGHRPE